MERSANGHSPQDDWISALDLRLYGCTPILFPVSGTLYFFTLGLFFVGWIVDLFLIPSMDRKADIEFTAGPIDYNVAWILLTFLGLFGIHRFYLGKWVIGIVYLLTGGIFLVGIIYDYWTLNNQINEINAAG